MESIQLLKEWDVDTTTRKWRGCLAKIKTKTPVPFAYITEVGEDDNGVIIHQKDVGPDGLYGPGYVNKTPLFEYYHFETRFYKDRTKAGTYYLIARRVNKTFKVGFCSDSYHIGVYDVVNDRMISGQGVTFSRIELESPTPITSYPFTLPGPISARLFCGKDHLFYLNTIIGFINRDDREIVLLEPSLEQEVRDAMKGHQCQIIV